MQANRFLVLFLTFMCYTAYHASRRPLSIVKSVLNGEPHGGKNPLGNMHGGGAPVERVWTASSIGEPAGAGRTQGQRLYLVAVLVGGLGGLCG
jgi:hypothetical protein